MSRRQASFFTVLFFISQLFRDNASQQCGAGGDLYSIYQMMLKGHTYKSFKTAPGTPECREACLADVRCQGWDGGRHSNDSSIRERNLKCTQYDAQHCLTHIFTEVSSGKEVGNGDCLPLSCACIVGKNISLRTKSSILTIITK